MAQAALILPLLFIIYEDVSQRAIHWFWIVLMMAIALLTFPWTLQYTFFNFFLVLFQMAALTLYFSWKEKKIVNIVNKYLGLGDLLFFLPLCVLFSPGNFIFFFIFSLLFSLTAHLVSYKLNPLKTTTIPLAAYMALALIVVLFGNFALDFDLQDDYWIKNKIANLPLWQN